MIFNIKQTTLNISLLIVLLISPLHIFASENLDNIDPKYKNTIIQNQIIENNNNNNNNNNNINNMEDLSPHPHNTTINLMWLQMDKADSVLPIKDKRAVFKRDNTLICLDSTLNEWAEKNPKVMINLWYDSSMLTENAVENTQELLKTNCKNYAQIQFKNIRNLKYVENFSEAFSKSILIYPRLDLLRMIASYEEVNNTKSPRYFVYADFSVEPMAWSDLMDEQTKKLLYDFGFVMARGVHGGGKYENGFFIMSNQNTLMNKAIRTAFIEVGLNQIIFNSWFPNNVTLGQETIFSFYTGLLFPVFYALKGEEYAKIYNKKTQKSYPQDFLPSTNFDELEKHLNEWFDSFSSTVWHTHISVETFDKAEETISTSTYTKIFTAKVLFIPTKPYPNGGEWPISRFNSTQKRN